MHTEEEAGEKWCPMDRLGGMRCGASKCMAWRWLDERRQWTVVHHYWPKDQDSPPAMSPPDDGRGSWEHQQTGPVYIIREKIAHREDSYFRMRTDQRGFCGMAGIPKC